MCDLKAISILWHLVGRERSSSLIHRGTFEGRPKTKPEKKFHSTVLMDWNKRKVHVIILPSQEFSLFTKNEGFSVDYELCIKLDSI